MQSEKNCRGGRCGGLVDQQKPLRTRKLRPAGLWSAGVALAIFLFGGLGVGRPNDMNFITSNTPPFPRRGLDSLFTSAEKRVKNMCFDAFCHIFSVKNLQESVFFAI